jgi:hypothetical protein
VSQRRSPETIKKELHDETSVGGAATKPLRPNEAENMGWIGRQKGQMNGQPCECSLKYLPVIRQASVLLINSNATYGILKRAHRRIHLPFE